MMTREGWGQSGVPFSFMPLLICSDMQWLISVTWCPGLSENGLSIGSNVLMLGPQLMGLFGKD